MKNGKFDGSTTSSDCFGGVLNDPLSNSGYWNNNSITWPVMHNMTNEQMEGEIASRVAKEMKRFVLVNRMSPEKQAEMVMQNPAVYDMLIEPSDEATQAYIMKTEL